MPRLLRVAVVLAALAFAASVAVVHADWPLSCVELNDMVERQRGQPANAGIYQRAYGDAAEAHCQADHREDVQRAFWWALGEGPAPVAPAAVPWPATCVDLNDLVEGQLGNDANVGIYQRAYGDGAESACQSDHAGDVRHTFGWAVPAPEPETEPPAPVAPSAPPASDHPDYEQVRQVAIARGAEPALAADIAAFVVTHGRVIFFLVGVDPDVAYGLYPCDWRSLACPLEPDVEPGLRPAWTMAVATLFKYIIPSEFEGWLTRIDDLTVRFEPLGPRVAASYRPYDQTIRISPALRGERDEAVAAVLAHELWHSFSPIPFPGSFTDCVADEVWAAAYEALTWLDLAGNWPRPDATTLERSLNDLVWVWADDAGARWDHDTDVSDWDDLLDYVLYDRGYAATCAA